MKLLFLALCGCFLGAIIASPISSADNNGHQLLGNRQCTWGPSFWCSNITNAKSCHAVTHCIQTVWEKHDVPVDNDSICKICLDMVQQARDQLESNETQTDLRDVFEGSCKLIPLKPIQKECIHLADNFVPELVEALSSQMNPQAVCSVAGLCNNAAIDKMLAELPPSAPAAPVEHHVEVENTKATLSCSQCNKISGIISDNFHGLNRDEILENMLYMCGKLSSFSDACANIVLVYFNEIYDHFKANLNANAICHLSGVCSEKFHQHSELIEIRPMSNVGYVDVKDDIPCELCEQLVRHLRDVLVANTTADEFKTVLKGLCGQTKSFKDECNSIVDQYYGVIYNTLVSDLNENEACTLIQICPRGLQNSNENIPIMPLLPMKTFEQIDQQVTITQKPKKFILGADEPKLTASQIRNAQLPIDTLLQAPNPELLVDGGQWCTICEYFLHFLQEDLATPQTEDNIKRAVSQTCDKLPKQVGPECHNFVDLYGDAVIALLIQSIDPREICPKLYICPQNKHEVEVFAPKPIHVKPVDVMDVTINTRNSGDDKCPLCLLAVQAAKDIIQTNKTKQEIMDTLNGLCRHLPTKLQDECTDFIDTYTSELVQMLSEDFTAQDICVNLKLCNGIATKPFIHPISHNGDIFTNEIPDNTVDGKVVGKKQFNDDDYELSPDCILCEKVVKEIEKQLLNQNSKIDIKNILKHACDRLPKYKNKCNAYVEKHGDEIIRLLIQETTPKEICRTLGYCILKDQTDLQIDEALRVNVVVIPANSQQPLERIYTIPADVTEVKPIMNISTKLDDKNSCVLCELVMVQLEKQLGDKKTQADIENAMKNVCKMMPKSINQECNKFVDQYGNLVIQLFATTPPKELCTKIALCGLQEFQTETKAEITECAVCHASAQALAKTIDNTKSPMIVHRVIDETCNQLPGKHYAQCSSLMDIYGQSLVNIISRDQLHTACSQIGKCFNDEYVSFVRIDSN